MTVQLIDVIDSIYRQNKMSETKNGNHLTWGSDKYSFIKKTQRYDSDIRPILDKHFFQGYKIDNEEVDRKFKQAFFNRFMFKTIKFQTTDVFVSHVIYNVMSMEDYIIMLFTELDAFMTGKSTATNKGKSTGTNDVRTANSTLPRDEFNVNVDNFELKSATDNSINRSKNVSDDNRESVSHSYNVGSLKEVQSLIDDVFTVLDRKCFSQVY